MSIFGQPSGAQPSLFGGTQQQSALGSSTQQQPSSTGSSLFGAQQQPSAGGLFNQHQPGLFAGTNQQQPSTGALFSGTNQQQPPAGGGLFNNTSQQQPSAGLFGAQQQPTTGGLFGSTTQQQQQQQPSITGGLFGNAPGGGLFGAQQQPTTGGLFGSTTQQQQQQQPITTGNLFGSTSQQQQQQQPTTSGGLFGATTTSGGGLFGSKPAGSLFGSTTTTAPATTSTGIFGQAPQQQQQRPGLFGSTTGGTVFGGGSSTLSTSALGRTASLTAQQQFDAQLQSHRLVQKLAAINEAWKPQSPQCRFQYNFYNLVDPSQVHLYGRPPNVTDAIWDKAVRENPDPSCLVPVIAVGFNDLRERVEAQARQAEKHQMHVKDFKARMDALNEQHTLSNLPRLQRVAAQQTQIQQRLMRFIQHLHLLIPALRSSSIRPEEEQLRGKLEELEEDVRRSRLKAKLNELWALLGAINASREGTKNFNGNGEWAVVDEEGMAQISQILAEQQTGLSHLTKILQKMTNDLDIIMGRSRRSSPSNGDDALSTSVLYESERLRRSNGSLLASGLGPR